MTASQPLPPPAPPDMSALDPSVLHVSKRKRTGNLLLQDYPVNAPNSPVVSFFGFSVETVSAPPPPSPPTQATETTQVETVRSPAATPPTRSHCPSPETPPQLSSLSWSFLAHPVLPYLRKWPGIPTQPQLTVSPSGSTPESKLAPPQSPEITEPPTPTPLKLLSLLDIPPVASSIASYLYGHDLLTLRQLNSDFHSLLSSRKSDAGKRPYYHTLLLKSLLCPRQDRVSEPVGISCKSPGGNVGPCMLCASVICGTCISPEIWTVKRYRYICPPCCAPSPGPVCTCQSTLWICRSCYKTHWLADLDYNISGWFNNHIVACGLCSTGCTNKMDARLPAPTTYSRGRKMEFKEWFVRAAKNGENGEKRRPVGCAWCQKRVDPRLEDWVLRPDAIRRGEEKGRLWIRELERRRREREREGREDEDDDEATVVAGN